MRSSPLHILIGFVSTIFVPACSAQPVEPPDDAGVIGACTLPYLGDPNAPIEMDVVALGPTHKLETITDGSDISLILPPQGGRVIFAGVHATNVKPCAVRLSGSLQDPVSKQVRLDSRIINLQVTPDGFGQSDISDIFTFANIATCPNQWSDQDLMDKTYTLTVSLTDKEDKKLTKTLKVVPRCDESGQINGCRCQCTKGYVLGTPCSQVLDGG